MQATSNIVRLKLFWAALLVLSGLLSASLAASSNKDTASDARYTMQLADGPKVGTGG